MAEALLDRLGKGAWAGGDLVKDLRKHLAPIVDLDKENDDEKLAGKFGSFLAKALSHTTKAAQGPEADYALEAGSVVIACFDKIRSNITYKRLSFEASVKDFISKAVAAKRFDIAEKHCALLIAALREHQSLTISGKEKKAAAAFLPHDKDDVDLTQLAVCVLVQRIACQLGQQKLKDENIDQEMAQTVHPWLVHLQKFGTDAMSAYDVLFRFYFNVSKTYEAATDIESFSRLIQLRLKALEYYSFKLLGSEGSAFITFYLGVASNLEASTSKNPERWPALLKMHASVIAAAESRLKGQWLNETSRLCAPWVGVLTHAAVAAAKSGDGERKRAVALVKRAEELLDKYVRRSQPAIAALHSARLVCIELELATEVVGKETEAAFAKLAAKMSEPALTTLDLKGTCATEELVSLALRLCKDLSCVRSALKDASGRLKGSALWKSAAARGNIIQHSRTIVTGCHALVLRGCSINGDLKARFAALRTSAMDGLEIASLVTAESDITQLDACRQLVQLLEENAAGAELSYAARGYYNVAFQLYKAGNYEESVKWHQRSCELTEQGATAGDAKCAEKLQARFAALAEARAKCDSGDSTASLTDLGRAVQLSFKGTPPVDSIDRFVRHVLRAGKAQPGLIATADYMKSALLTSHLGGAKPALTSAQIAAILLAECRSLQAHQAEAMDCAAAVLQAVMASLKKLCTGVQAARLLVEEAKQARVADKRGVALKRLAEAEAMLQKEKTVEVSMDLAFVHAWRLIIAIEADHVAVRSALIDDAKAAWSKIIDQQLPNADILSLRLGLRMLLNFVALHDQPAILLAFARLSVRFEEKAAVAGSPLELCAAQLWVTEASYACGLQKSATVSLAAALGGLKTIKPTLDCGRLQLRAALVLAYLGRNTEAATLWNAAHTWISSQAAVPNDSRALYHYTTAALLAEGVTTIVESDDLLGEAHAHASAALRHRRGTLARSGDDATFSNDSILTEVCDMAVLRAYVQELHLAGMLASEAGFPIEADAHFSRGADLALKVAAPRTRVRFMLGKISVEYHKQEPKHALEQLENLCGDELVKAKGVADEDAEERVDDVLDVLIDMRFGDAHCRNREYTEAKGSYESADEHLKAVIKADSEFYGEAVSFPVLAARLQRKLGEVAFIASGDTAQAIEMLEPIANASIPREALRARLFLAALFHHRASKEGQIDMAWDFASAPTPAQAPLSLSSSTSGKKKAAARATAPVPVAKSLTDLDRSLSEAIAALELCRSFSSPAIMASACGLIAEASGPSSAGYRAAKAMQEGMASALRHGIFSHAVRQRISPSTASGADAQLAAAMDQFSLGQTDDLRVFGFSALSAAHREALIAQLPKQWTVCTLGVTNDHSHLLVCRFSSGQAPLVMRLPLRDEQSDHYEDLQRAFKEIMTENTTVLDNPALREPGREKDWWAARTATNGKLAQLCSDLEDRWLAHWKGVLRGTLAEEADIAALQGAVEKVLPVLRKVAKAPVDTQLVEILMDSMTELEDDALQAYLLRILGWPSSGLSAKDLAVLDKVQAAVGKASAELNMNARREPLILVLDKHTQALPWECIPLLFEAPVCRAPSLHFIAARAAQLARGAPRNPLRDGVDERKAFYVLNPTRDLQKTQKVFEAQFNARKWPGVAGKEPDQEWLHSHMEKSDLFVYCGHNACEAYLKAEYVQKLARCPVALLVGCSSGKLIEAGDYEPYGHILAYLQGGAAAALGNLWHVTDSEIDKFTEALLNGWLGSAKSLPEVIPTARRACRFPYLTAAAPVCYGVPVYIRGSPALQGLGKNT